MTKARDISRYGLGVGIQSAGSVVTGVGITQLNFIGAGNTFRVSGGTVDISISGGGGVALLILVSLVVVVLVFSLLVLKLELVLLNSTLLALVIPLGSLVALLILVSLVVVVLVFSLLVLKLELVLLNSTLLALVIPLGSLVALLILVSLVVELEFLLQELPLLQYSQTLEQFGKIKTLAKRGIIILPQDLLQSLQR
jgi:hypothetical protein